MYFSKTISSGSGKNVYSFIDSTGDIYLAFFAEERCTFLKTKTGKNCDLDLSLDQIQKQTEPEMFFRINRNFLLNIHFITEMISYSGNRIKVKLGNFSND